MVNPAARYKKDSPCTACRSSTPTRRGRCLILKRSLKPGFAGEDNEFFYDKKTMMVFGDAKATLTTMVKLLKQ